jgi:DNA end-binding protein Ku
MRAMWKGAVSFGLVNVPVKMYTATTSHDISFHQVHRTDGGRIRYKRVCDVCGEQVAYDDIAKGYESEDGQLVILTDEDLAELPVASSREIGVEKFVPSDQIDPMWMEKSYYLEPEKSGAKPYALLREALREADRMALVTISIRQRSTMAVLRVRDDVIVLQTLLWPDEIRKPDFGTLDGDETARPQELAMAASLVESLSGDYDPDEFNDEYREEMEHLVDAKLTGGETAAVPQPKQETGGGEVVDLLSALQRSVERAREARGEEPSQPAAKKGAAAKKAPAATRSAAKKAPAKSARKAATKKAASSKTAGSKSAASKSTASKSTASKSTASKSTAKKTAIRKSA